MKKNALLFTGLLAFFLVVVNRKKVVQTLLTAEQELFIRDLNPGVQNLFRQFIRAVELHGWAVLITSAYRSFASQAVLYAENTANAAPGYSYHNYGLAIDINASNSVIVLRKASTKQDWLNSGIPQIAQNLGLRWGGNFTTYYDPVHFDAPILPTAQLREMAIKRFGSNPADIYGNQLNLAA